MDSSRALQASILASIFATYSAPAFSERYPARPVRLIVPFAPGGSTDVLGRLVGQKLGENLGQQFVVDNRPGAGGTIGTDITAKAQPDGYTIVLVTVAFSINASLHKKLPYHPTKDLSAVALVASAPNLLIVHPSLPVKTVAEFVTIAKQTPGSFHYASAGVGTPTHLAAELFNSATGTKLVHVPYKGGGPGLADVIAGQVKVMFPGIISGLGQVRNGKLKGLAVTSRARSRAAPEIATVAESGYPSYEAVNWFAVLAPAGTPRHVIDALNAQINKIVRSSDMAEKMARDGAEPIADTPAAARDHIQVEIDKWRKVVLESGAAAS